MTDTLHVSAFTPDAVERLKSAPRRGAFRPIDAARRQLGLLTATDDHGQMRAYWLIDLDQQTVAEARFLAYGTLSSHVVGDAFTQLVRERPVDEALAIDSAAVQSLLGEDPFGDGGASEHYAWIPELTAHLRAALPEVKLLPKPVEKERYVRKREQDWNDVDRSWLPLSLLKKIGKAQTVLTSSLKERLGTDDVTIDIQGLHDDFRIVLTIDGLRDEQKPTVTQFLTEAAHQHLHPQCIIEEAS